MGWLCATLTFAFQSFHFHAFIPSISIPLIYLFIYTLMFRSLLYLFAETLNPTIYYWTKRVSSHKILSVRHSLSVLIKLRLYGSDFGTTHY